MLRSLRLLTPVAAILLTLCACNPVDRSGEQPFAPTVHTRSAAAVGTEAVLTGEVTASPNSPITACGFIYGNDTLRLDTLAAAPAAQFSVATRTLEAGRYYAVAYARNGIGTSHGDTLFFTIGN